MSPHNAPSSSSIDTFKEHAELFPEVGETSPDSEGMARPIFRVLEVPVAFYAQDDEAKMAECNEAEAAPVVASPIGLAEAALHLGNLPEDSRAAHLRDSLQNEDYNSDVLKYLDQINAAVSYDSESEGEKNFVDTEGFALIVAALSGDQLSETELNARYDKWLQAVTEAENEHKEVVTPEARVDAQEFFDNTALVHATKYPIERDENGNVVLTTTGDHRRRDPSIGDRRPRATLHFTLNGEVSSHIEGSWSESNRLIVTTIGHAVEANGLPYALRPVDTSFDVQPGSVLTLPEAFVVEPSPDAQTLLSQNEATITYKHSETYTDRERSDYAALAGLSVEKVAELSDGDIAKGLRKLALSRAMQELGVSKKEPVEIGPMESGDAILNTETARIARLMSLDALLHSQQPNAKAEQYDQRKYEISGTTVTATLPIGTSRAGQRMYVANGYLAPEKRDVAARGSIQEEEL